MNTVGIDLGGNPGPSLLRVREDTPGCAHRVHLNNAGAALMPTPVIRAIKDYIDLESRIGGYEAEAASRPQFEQAYSSVASLIGSAPENVALTENATVSFAQALSSIPFQAGDVILTTRNDYASNQIQFLSLGKRLGVEVVRAPDTRDGGVDVTVMAKLIRSRRPVVVCVTHIPTNSGLIQDVEAIGKICREEDILYLVDACQSVGQMPVDVEKIGCDFLSATSRKFLRGPRGAGFLFVSDRALEKGLTPLFPDMGGADWVAADEYEIVKTAKRFENWEFSFALVLGTGAAAAYALSVGLDAIQQRVRMLSEKLRTLLEDVDGVRVLDRGLELGGIISVATDNCAPRKVVATLREQGINLSSQARTSAVIDYDEKRVSAALRLSPHYYNTEEECDRTVNALRALM